MLDARKKEVYSAVFQWEQGTFKRIIGEMAIKPVDLIKELKDIIIFSGEGVLLYKDKIMEMMKGRAIIASTEKMIPSPANVAILGLEKAARGEYTDASEAVPFYIRRSEAELKWSGKS